MPIRLSGMASGLDTDTIIKGMVDAQRLKNKKVSDKSQVLDWKQERLKEINAKLYKLYSEDLTKLRLQSGYSTKKVTSSNENLISVTGSNNAPTGTSSITITNTAVSQSVIGGVLDKDASGNAVTTSTKLSSLAGSGFTVGSEIVITNGTKESSIKITEDTTINDFLTQCKSAGLNASFDTTQKRIFISAKNSGVENKFSIKQYGTGTVDNRNNIKELVGYAALTDADKNKVTSALDVLSNTASTPESIESAKKELTKFATSKVENAQTNKANAIALNQIMSKISNELISKGNITDKFNSEFKDEESFKNSTKYETIRKELIVELKYDSENITVDQEKELLEKGIERYKQELVVYEDLYKKEYDSSAESIREKIKNNEITDLNGLSEEEYIASKIKEKTDSIFDTMVSSDKKKYFIDLTKKEYASNEFTDDSKTQTWSQYYSEKVSSVSQGIYNSSEYVAERTTSATEFSTLIDNYENNGTTTAYDVLSLLKLGEISDNTSTGTGTNGMTFAKAEDAKINYNGIDITSSSNVINVNGLTITIKGKTAAGETININTTNDAQGTFDAVKKFVTNYNAILKELNTLYYADSAKGYAPLSDDEKEAMTDDQIEKWETKIKDSMLRRDSNVGKIITTLKTSLMQSVEASDGKKYSLANFGIGTSSDYTEKGLLHIDGDPDDAAFSKSTNKLMKALESDPDLVAEVLSKTIDNLYKEVDKNIKAIPNVRSAFTFYNDKLMSTQQTEYKKKIATLESKLVTLENKYYKQFSAMETAMAKLQSQSNALAGMLGTGGN